MSTSPMFLFGLTVDEVRQLQSLAATVPARDYIESNAVLARLAPQCA